MRAPPPSTTRAATKAASAATAAAPRVVAPSKRAAAAARASSSSSPPPPDPAAAAALKAETTQKWRRIILTVAFAAVTFTGTIYGAGLKTQQEWKAEKQRVQEASADEKIALLSQHRADLMRQKWEIEGKLAELRARMKGNAEAGESGGPGGGPR